MRKLDPVELVQIEAPMLAQVVALTAFLGVCLMILIILATPMPA